MTDAICAHLSSITTVRHAQRRECAECVKIGARWVHLRCCQECGVTLCCDSSPNRHATSHFQDTKHPIVKSFEPGEDWAWCYVHEDMVETIRAFPIESPSEHHAPPQAAP